jgi:integrase
MAVALKVVQPDGWLDQVLEDFERDMLRRALRPNTVRIYRWAAQDLFDFLKATYNVSDIKELDRDRLQRWQDAMVNRELRASTRAMAVSAARQLLNWAADNDLVDPRLVRGLTKVRTKPGRPRPLARADVLTIQAYLLPRRPHMGIVALRDRALFSFILTTSARVSEALQLRRDELVDPVIFQKGGTEKMLMFPGQVGELIEDYLRSRIDDSPYVWISHRTNTPLAQLRPPGVRSVWQKLARKLGIPPFTTHQLRHTCATELRNAHIPDAVIEAHMGHRGTSL